MSVYYELGLSVTNIEDSHIKEAFKENYKDAKKIISLSNARNNKFYVENNMNYCSYCDVEKQRPLVANSFRLYCYNLQEYLKKPIAYFYSNSRESSNVLTTDHITPHSKGGLYTDKNNLAPCCSDCNTKKKNILFSEFYQRFMLTNREKYGSFIEEMIVNPEYQKFVDAINFVEPEDNKPFYQSRPISKKIKQYEDLSVLNPISNISDITNIKSVRGDKQVIVYFNCKLRSINKLKQNHLKKLLLVLTTRLDDYKAAIKQIFTEESVESFDYEWAIKKIKAKINLVGDNDKVIPTKTMDYKIEMSDDDYWFDYTGKRLPFSDMSDEYIKKIKKSLKHSIIVKSFRYIPNTFIDRETVDSKKVLERFNLETSKRNKLCKESELL